MYGNRDNTELQFKEWLHKYQDYLTNKRKQSDETLLE